MKDNFEYDNKGNVIGGFYEIKGSKKEPKIFLGKNCPKSIGSTVYVYFIDKRKPRYKSVMPEDIEIEDDSF